MLLVNVAITTITIARGQGEYWHEERVWTFSTLGAEEDEGGT